MITIPITCYGYVSRPGDSLLSISRRFAKRSGVSVKRYLRWLVINNKANLLHSGIDPAHPERMIPKPHSGLCLMPPVHPVNPIQYHPFHHDMAMAMSNDKLNMLESYHFYRLMNDTDLPSMSATAQLATTLQWLNAKQHQQVAMGAAGTTLISAADAVTDYTKERAEKLLDKMREVEDKLKAFLAAPDAAKAEAKAAFFAEHKALNEQFQREIKTLVRYNSSKPQIRFITEPEAMLDMAKHAPSDGSNLIEVEAMRSVAHVAAVAKFVGRGLAVLDLGLIGKDTYETYEQGGDWQQELIEELAGFAGGWIGGYLALRIIGGALGWYVVIPIMIANMIGELVFKELAESVIN